MSSVDVSKFWARRSRSGWEVFPAALIASRAWSTASCLSSTSGSARNVCPPKWPVLPSVDSILKALTHPSWKATNLSGSSSGEYGLVNGSSEPAECSGALIFKTLSGRLQWWLWRFRRRSWGCRPGIFWRPRGPGRCSRPCRCTRRRLFGRYRGRPLNRSNRPRG